jgi:hypothetical protein
METNQEEAVESNPGLEILRDGILAASAEMILGTDFDTAAFGPAGNPIVKDAIRFDKEWYEIFGGASAGLIAQGISDATSLAKGSYYMAVGSDDDPDNVFALNSGDILDAFKPISSVNNTIKVLRAAQVGKWMSSNETVLADIDLQDAIASALTGLEKEDITDIYLRLESSKDVKNYINEGRREVQKEYQRARRSIEIGDMDAFEYHIRRAKAFGVVYALTDKDMARASNQGFSMDTLEEASKERYDNYVREYYKRKNNQ